MNTALKTRLKAKLDEITVQDIKIIAIAANATFVGWHFDHRLLDAFCALVVVWAGVALLVQYSTRRKRERAAASKTAGRGEESAAEGVAQPSTANA